MKKINDVFEWVLRRAVIILVFASIIDVFAQVLFRYVFHSPIAWTEQAARYLFLFMCMLGLPVAFRNKGLIAFDLIVEKFPKKVQAIIGFFGMILTGAFSAFYLVQSIRLFIRVGHKVAANVLHLPVRFEYSAQVICAFFLTLFAIELLIESGKTLFKAGKEETEL